MDTDPCEHCGGSGVVYNLDGGVWLCPCPAGGEAAKKLGFKFPEHDPVPVLYG